MNGLKFKITPMANVKVFIRDFLDSLFSKFCLVTIGTTDFIHDFKFTSFYNGIWNKQFAELPYPVDGTVPSPNWATDDSRFLIGRDGANDSFNSFLKPIKKILVGIRDCNISLVNGAFTISGSRNGPRNVNSTFSIHDSGKIANFMLGKLSTVKVLHMTPILNVCEGV